MAISGLAGGAGSSVQKAVDTKPAASVDTKPAASTDTSVKPTSGQPVDNASVTADAAKPAEDPRASKLLEGLGDNYGASTQKADTWKKGPNDTIEGMLKGRGFSLKDIYTKDASGKNMVDRVLAANNLKDARKMKDGQEMMIPDLGSKGGGTSTNGLKPGETTGEKQVGDHKIESQVLPDGSKQSDVETKNGTEVGVNSPGDSTNATRVQEDGSTTTQTLAKDANGQVTTQVDTTTKGDQDQVSTTALKGDLTGQVGQDGSTVKNGDVTVNTDYSEKKQDGFFENAGRGVAEFFGAKPDPAAPVDVQGKNVTTNIDGNNITVTADGKQVAEFNQDADDSWVERGGAAIDSGVNYVAEKGKQAVDYVGNAASSAANAVGNAASGFWNWMTGG